MNIQAEILPLAQEPEQPVVPIVVEGNVVVENLGLRQEDRMNLPPVNDMGLPIAGRRPILRERGQPLPAAVRRLVRYREELAPGRAHPAEVHPEIEPGDDPEAAPVRVVDPVQQQRERLLANQAFIPNRFPMVSRKRNNNHINENPENPPFVFVPLEEEIDKDFLFFFTKRARPSYCEFADTDLVHHLRKFTFCVTRTPNLIQTLKLKADRYMNDFDKPNHTPEQVYRVITSSITAAMVITPEEKMMVDTIDKNSNMIQKYQPFFRGGLYRTGFLRRYFNVEKHMA